MYASLNKPARYAERKGEGLEIQIVTAPAMEPVTLEEAKVFCRIDTDDDNTIVEGLISAVRAEAERYANCAFLTQTLIAQWLRMNDYVILPRPPHQSISKVEVYDGRSWIEITRYDQRGLEQKRVYFNRSTFTLTSYVEESARITFVAGIADDMDHLSADKKAIIQHAIFDSVAYAYQSRGEQQEGGLLTPVSMAFLDNIKTWG